MRQKNTPRVVQQKSLSSNQRQQLNGWMVQATACYQQTHYDDAIAICYQILTMAPEHIQALNLIGVSWYLKHEQDKAQHYFKKALILEPNASNHVNMALSLAEARQTTQAQAHYRKALRLDARLHQAWNNLGNLLVNGHDQQAIQEAISYYEKALALKPDYASASTNLAFAYEQIGDWVRAETQYRRTLDAAPYHVPALSNFAGFLHTLGRLEEAVGYYERALIHAPGNVKCRGELLSARTFLAQWKEEPLLKNEFMKALESEDAYKLAPLTFMADPDFTPEQLRGMGQKFAQAFWGAELALTPCVTQTKAAKGRRLRVGYLSADFRNHPVTHLIIDVLAAHDQKAMELFLYGYGPVKSDAQREQLQKIAEHFLDISELSDREAAQKIGDDGIDLLVDLTGYTSYARLGITARRPAAVIVSWLGFVGSLGEPRMADYILGDAIATPFEHAAHFSETIVQLPHCFQPNAHYGKKLPAPTRQYAGLPETGIVFCSFNQTFKLNPEIWDDWCEILRETPNSVLWLAATKSPRIEHNLRQEAQHRGISAERLIFAPHLPLDQHLARIPLADLALDTFPYNSGATASDALRAGVPMVTRMGKTFVSRMGASLLHHLGLDELINTSREDYRKLAILLAHDQDRRTALREKLEDKLTNAALFDPARFARDLEKAFAAMHVQACLGVRLPMDVQSL